MEVKRIVGCRTKEATMDIKTNAAVAHAHEMLHENNTSASTDKHLVMPMTKIDLKAKYAQDS